MAVGFSDSSLVSSLRTLVSLRIGELGRTTRCGSPEMHIRHNARCCFVLDTRLDHRARVNTGSRNGVHKCSGVAGATTKAQLGPPGANSSSRVSCTSKQCQLNLAVCVRRLVWRRMVRRTVLSSVSGTPTPFLGHRLSCSSLETALEITPHGSDMTEAGRHPEVRREGAGQGDAQDAEGDREGEEEGRGVVRAALLPIDGGPAPTAAGRPCARARAAKNRGLSGNR